MTAHSPEPKSRRSVPLALVAALAVTLAAGALGGWLHQRLSAQQRSEFAAAFDLNLAMELAGAQVPPEIESFYFFFLERDKLDESADLADKLGQAANEQDYIGIVGADAQHNRKVLLAAMEAARSGALDGLVIIYVGPPEQEAELAAVISARGAELRFVPYLRRAPAAVSFNPPEPI